MSNTQSRRDVLAGGASIAAASLAFPLTRAEPGSSATETAFNTRRETFVLGARKSDWDALRRRLRGVLFDLPHALEGGRKTIAQAGLTDRCEVVSGDFFVSIPSGADVYMLSRVSPSVAL
jgi:hypothetical protein